MPRQATKVNNATSDATSDTINRISMQLIEVSGQSHDPKSFSFLDAVRELDELVSAFRHEVENGDR